MLESSWISFFSLFLIKLSDYQLTLFSKKKKCFTVLQTAFNLLTLNYYYYGGPCLVSLLNLVAVMLYLITYFSLPHTLKKDLLLKNAASNTWKLCTVESFTPFEPLNNKYYPICDLTLFSFVPLCLSFCLRWIYVIKVGVHLLFWSALFVFVICLLYNIMPIYQPLLLYYDTTSVQAMMHSHGFIPVSTIF